MTDVTNNSTNLPIVLDPSFLHGWALFTRFKREGDLDRHLQNLLRLVATSCPLTVGKSAHRLTGGEIYSIVKECDLNPQHITAYQATRSDAQKAATNKKISDTVTAYQAARSDAQKTATNKKISDAKTASMAARTDAQKTATSNKWSKTVAERTDTKKAAISKNISNAKAAMSVTKKAAVETRKMETIAAQRMSKPYHCRQPKPADVTTISSIDGRERANSFSGLCHSCAYDDADILPTLEPGYAPRGRNLQWIRIKGHGVVLCHYYVTKLCGIICHRSTGLAVRKRDFEAKMAKNS